MRREREAVRIREELKIVEETKKIDIQEEPKEISLTEEQLQKISFENKKRMMSLKRLDFEEVSLNESAQLDKRVSFFFKKVLYPWAAKNQGLHFVVDGGYMLRFRGKVAAQPFEHFTSDLDLLILKKSEEIRSLKEIKNSLATYLYRHLDLRSYSILITPYCIKISFKSKGGYLPIIDIGLNEESQGKYQEKDLDDSMTEALSQFFKVDFLSTVRLNPYRRNLLARMRLYLDETSDLSQNYQHKLPSWMSQIHRIYEITWEERTLESQKYFLDLYEQL